MSSFAENFLKLLSTALESVDMKQTALAASAIWALLHNCSKVIILTLYTLYSYLTHCRSKYTQFLDLLTADQAFSEEI